MDHRPKPGGPRRRPPAARDKGPPADPHERLFAALFAAARKSPNARLRQWLLAFDGPDAERASSPPD